MSVRVFTKRRTKGDTKSYTCDTCHKKIVAGETYHEWTFWKQAPRRRHASCGYPKPSERTQSKLSAVYAAQESFDVEKATTPDEIGGAVRDVAEAVREVAQEYHDAAEAMGGADGAGSQHSERAEELEWWADELDQTADEIENDDRAEDDDEDADMQLDRLREQARNAVDDCPV